MWIALLLLAILGLVATVAWQAYYASENQRNTAAAVLTDYAELAADEFSRRATVAVGYQGYFAATNQLRSDSAGTQRPAPVLRILDADDEIEQLRTGAGALQEDSPFQIVHRVRGDTQNTFVLFSENQAKETSGFEVDRQWLSTTLLAVVDAGSLLPASLGEGELTNELLDVRFDDSIGKSIIDTGRRWQDAPTATKTLAEEYSGIFRGHTVTISIDPGAAEALLIGGLPRSRLPELLLILGVLIVLLILAIRQLQKESQLAQLRNNFVAEVSHELRTPLTQIRMFTESLIHSRLTSEDDRSRALSVIDRESRRLSGMVDNILEFSDAAAGETALRLERTFLAPLIRSVADDFQPIADVTSSQVMLELDEDASANVDPDAMRQVLLNLLDNAIKYGPEQQAVRLSLQSQDGGICISVCDEGAGIPVAEREQVWNSYTRLERDQGSAIAGTGIGLAVVQSLVLRHSGTVRIEDAAGGGACFVVELPA